MRRRGEGVHHGGNGREMSTDSPSDLLASEEETDKDVGNPGNTPKPTGEKSQIPEKESCKKMSKKMPFPSFSSPAAKKQKTSVVNLQEKTVRIFGETLPLLYLNYDRSGNKGAEMHFIFGPRKSTTQAWSSCFAACATEQLTQPFEWSQLFASIENVSSGSTCSPPTEDMLEEAGVKYITCRHPTNLEKGGGTVAAWIPCG